jgi:hypothetical protein
MKSVVMANYSLWLSVEWYYFPSTEYHREDKTKHLIQSNLGTRHRHDSPV